MFMLGTRERTFAWAIIISEFGWPSGAEEDETCRVSRSVRRGGRDRQRGTGRLRPAPSPGSGPSRGAAAPAGGTGRADVGRRPTRRSPSGTPTPGAVSWSPLPLFLARRTRQPPRVPRRAGRRERAPAPVRLLGMFVFYSKLPGGATGQRPPVRGRPALIGGFHGDHEDSSALLWWYWWAEK